MDLRNEPEIVEIIVDTNFASTQVGQDRHVVVSFYFFILFEFSLFA